MRATSWLPFLAALLLAPVSATAAKCTDATAVADARAAVEAACDCAAATSNGAYVRCAVGVLKARVDAGTLPKACTGTVKKCAARSSCGRDGMVACCLPRPDGTSRCKATTSAKCQAGGGCASAFASCCDACAGNGCAVPTTTTTTTTLAPVCGNGVIEGTEQCDGDDVCQPNCIFTRLSCCDLGEEPNVCTATVPTYTFIAQQYSACQALAGSGEPFAFRLGLVPAAGACAGNPERSAGPCVTAPAYATPLQVCHRLAAGGCEQKVFANATELTSYVWGLAYADPSGWADDVVLGTCSAGACIPAH